jgi:tetratricopeptide (TPR) repeat protein
MAKLASDPLHTPAVAKRRRRWVAAGAAGSVLLAYLIVAYAVLPDDLPAVWQRLLGLGCVGTSLVVYLLATRKAESVDELMRRLRPGQHADFGKALRANRPKPGTIKLPLVGRTRVRPLGGVAVVLAVGAWWLSPWAPVGVRRYRIEDLTGVLSQEIVAASLAIPNPDMAIAQVPYPSERAQRLAALIPEGSGSYQLALKAIAQGRGDDARHLLTAAMGEEAVDPRTVLVARGLNEMYAGRYADAVQWYASAVDTGPEDLMLLLEMAVACIHSGDIARAESCVARAIAACDKQEGKDLCRAAALNLEAMLAAYRGTGFDEAQRLCVEARKLLDKQQQQEAEPLLLAANLNNQAALYLLRGNHHGAEQLYDGALELWKKSLGPDDPHVAGTLANLAMLHCRLGQFEEAGRRLAEARQVLDRRVPKDHAVRASMLCAEATLDTTANRLDAAKEAVAQATSIAEKTDDVEGPQAVAALIAAARLHARQAHYWKADALCARAAAAADRLWGSKHPFVADILDEHARVYLAQNRADDAIKLSEQALETSRAALGPDHPSIAYELDTRGRCEVARQQPQFARRYFEDARAILEKTFGAEHPELACTLGSLAALDQSPLTYPKGVSTYERAIAMATKFFGESHPVTARLKVGLAVLHAGQANYAVASTLLAEAEAVQQKVLAPGDPELAATLEKQAEVLLALDPSRTQEAAALRERAEAVRKEHAALDRPE